MATGKLFENGVGWRDFAATDIPASGVTAGSYGDGTHVGAFTVAANGTISAASSVAITGGGGGSIPSGGAAGQVVGYGGSSGTGAWVYPPGYQFDYAQITANVTVSGTFSGTQTTVITGNAVTYDGATQIKVEFFAPVIEPAAAANAFVAVELWDGATDLMELCGSNVPAAGTLDFPCYGAVLLTPSAAAHTYIVKAYRQSAGSNGLIAAGAGVAGAFAPAFLRVSKA